MTETDVLDPIATARDIGSSYARYLRSTFSPRSPQLHDQLRNAIDREFQLTRGPYLQAAAPYEPGCSIAELVAEGLLNDSLMSLPEATFPVDRPLYRHQELAIRKLIGGRNLVIATGTGSGKTECFLFPVLHHLLSEGPAGTLDEAGVRALLLYPMNALANDQLKRLRDLLVAFPQLTFGRFVGDTPERDSEALTSYRLRFGRDPLPNELISREQIRRQPPHILLTNYAMLEYLLLRPADNTLFDGPTGKHWRFVVLDEVHVYNGAQGAEIAMLLRRVRDRVHGSTRGRLLFVGTSATLGSGEDEYPALATYASQLFDERCEYVAGEAGRQDVVPPYRRPLVSGVASWDIEDVLEEAHAGVVAGHSAAALAGIFERCASPRANTNQPAEAYLADVLSVENHVILLQKRLESGSVDFADVASELFPGPSATRSLALLIDLGVKARSEASSAPLLPARYHFLLRALEGAFVCRSPKHPAGRTAFRLARHESCPDCRDAGHESRMFELGLCRRCGAAYLVGRLEDASEGPSVLRGAPLFESDLFYLLLDDLSGEEDEDESALVEDGQAATNLDQRVLCTGCGTLTEGGLIAACACGHDLAARVVVAHPTERGEPLRRCPACSGRSNEAIVSRFTTGQDAPVSVIATSLYQSLPSSGELVAASKVGEGRKLLSFSDSRQDAAFFAPYLDRTYARAVERRLIWEVLSRSDGDQPRFDDLVLPIRRAAEEALVLDPDDGAKRNGDRVRSWLMREVLAVDRRQSLDGVGLAELTVAIPRGVTAPEALRALGFADHECLDLARILLDTLRMQAAVHLPEGVDITDPIFAPRNVVTAVRLQQRATGVLSWMPGQGLNRRLDYLQKLFTARECAEDAASVLSEIWTRWIAAPQSPWLKVMPSRNDRREGTVFALDPEWITFLPATETKPGWQCPTCRQIWWRSIANVCPTYRCGGGLAPIEPSPRQADDHYRRLYTQMKPIGLRVEEHTGQLDARYAGELQQAFLDGDVNVLSCSTTFELGVDVGEVQAILMRNVPPSPANYVQRAGRAGRRLGAPALIVSFAQRRNHDIHYFDHPKDMIDGVVSAPIVSIENPQIVRRHLHAVAFAAFERHHVDAGGRWHQTVGSFFMPPDEASPSPVDAFVDWLRSRPPDLRDAIRRITPSTLVAELGVDDGGWVDALVNEENRVENHGWLARARKEVQQDLSELADEIRVQQTRIREATDANDHPRSQRLTDYLRVLLRVQETLSKRRLIDFLAQRVVLPKYGFPVDVVTLDVWRTGDPGATKVELQRDLSLGILDYAPGSRVVANKTLWETTGLRVPAGRALIDYVWATCKECGAFRTRRGSDPGECTICSSPHVQAQRQFISPMFGFIGHRCEEKPGEARPPRAGTAEVHFSDYAVPAPEFGPVVIGSTTIEVRFSRQGQITVINSGPAGRGFRICRSCGHTEPVPVSRRRSTPAETHSRPTGRSACSSLLSVRHLGHQYLTDVVEVVLPVEMSWPEATSTLFAVLAATQAIGIIRNDVNGALRATGIDRPPSLVIFDAVPGGAGHARRIVERISDLLRGALRVVESCECGIDSSCYGCLRSYSNQTLHDLLVRGDAVRVLKGLVQ